MPIIDCNIAILLESDLEKRVIATSHRLASPDTLFTLEIGKYYPHISLFFVQFDTRALGQVGHLLQHIAEQTPPLNLTADGYHQSSGYLDIGYHQISQTAQLQDTVITAVNPLRAGTREKDQQRLGIATDVELQNLQKFGYRAVGPLFRPHITLTRYRDKDHHQPSDLPEPSDFDGSFTKLGLFELGPNGTCTRPIATFDLMN